MSRTATTVGTVQSSARLDLPSIDRRGWRSRQALLHRIRAEYEEMPGLSLTLPQAALLFGLPQPTCERVLQALVAERFLSRTAGGRFVISGMSGTLRSANSSSV